MGRGNQQGKSNAARALYEGIAMHLLCFYEKQNDGTYTIYVTTDGGGNKEIVETGVRPCNVRRRIDSLYTLN